MTVETISIDLITDPLTVMDKDVYDPTNQASDIFAAVNLKMNSAGPVFTGVMTAPAGSAAAPAIHGLQADTGFHFPTDKVGVAADGSNVMRIGKDDTTVTNDTFLIVGRTATAGGHGYPQLALRCVDQATPDGAGPFIRFQSYNDAGELLECAVNAGLVDATDGAEQGGWDFSVFRDGASEVIFAMSADETMVGPTVDDVYDLARATWRFKKAFFSSSVEVGTFAKAALPSATRAGQIIYVSDDTGGAVLAFSDGTNWRRVTDRNVIS